MANMNFGVHVLPNETNNYDLGSTSKEWKNVYAKTVAIDGVQAATQADLNNLKPAVSNHSIVFSESNESVTYGAEFVTSTNNASSATLTGAVQSDTISNGKIIYYMLAYATPANTNVTLTLSYPSGSNSGAIPVYLYGSNRLNQTLPANSMLTLVYYSSAFYVVSTPVAIVM